MASPARILVACSDSEGRQALTPALPPSEFELIFSSTVTEVRALLARGAVVVCAAELSDGCFRDVPREVKQSGLRLPVIVASRSDDVNQYLNAMEAGAFDYITRPCPHSELERVLKNALQRLAAAA